LILAANLIARRRAFGLGSYGTGNVRFGVQRIRPRFCSSDPIKSDTSCKGSSQHPLLGRLWEDPKAIKAASIASWRFPPPWSVEEQDACFVVRDHNGQQLAYVYFEDEPGRRWAAKL